RVRAGRTAGRGAHAARPRHAGAPGLRPRRPPRAGERQRPAPAHRRAAQAARGVRAPERRRDVPARRGLLREAQERVPLIRAAIRVPLAQAEEARARFLELAPDGFEEAEAGEEVELAAYGDAADRVLNAFPHADRTEVEPGWEDRWREFHRPVRVGPLWIGP